MFRYANPYDFEPRVAEGDQVDYMDIVQGVDEFDGQDVETEGWRLNSMLWCNIFVKHLHKAVMKY